MPKIADRVLLGEVAGIASLLFFALLDGLAVWTRLVRWHALQLTASLFYPPNELHSFQAWFMGTNIGVWIGGVSGVAITYLLVMTGRSYYPLKGASVTFTLWPLLFAGVARLGGGTGLLDTPTMMTHFLMHVSAGALTALLIVALADESVWNRPLVETTNDPTLHLRAPLHEIPEELGALDGRTVGIGEKVDREPDVRQRTTEGNGWEHMEHLGFRVIRKDEDRD